MELQLVSFEQAKALKELGFPQDIDTTKWYSGGRVLYSNKPLDYLPVSFVAPTLELVAKWLREEKDICLSMNYNSDYKIWQCSSTATYNEEDYVSQSYEEALSTGIDKTIEILKSKKNNND